MTLTLMKSDRSEEEGPRSRMYEVVVRREIPCAPFWAPVTEPEVAYLGLSDVIGRTRFLAKSLAEVEARLMTLSERTTPKHWLDRTYLAAVDIATGIEAPIKMDLSELGEG